MRYRQLQGSCNIHLPPLIYGTAWKKERTAELVEKAIVCGFTGIDTACQPKHYHEVGVGDALRRLTERGFDRKALFLQTKFTPIAGQDPLRVPYDPSASITQQVHQSLQVSLKNLQVSYVDGLLLHSPYPRHEQTMEAWRAMEELCQQAKAHQIGISNCYDLVEFKRIFDEASIKPSLLQNRFYAETNYDKGLRRWCRENHIRYQAFWTLTANPHILSHSILQAIAQSKCATVEQVFFRFLTLERLVPLIGTCSEKHMSEDLAIFAFTLTDDEISAINAII